MLSGRLPRDRSPNLWARLLEERRAAGAELVDLTEANPTRVGLGGVDREAMAALASAAAERYEPDARGAPRARAAVADYYAARGAHVEADHVVLTTGTSEAYGHLLRLLADPGQTVLCPAPSYPLFEPLVRLEGVRLGTYRLAYDGAWHLDRASLATAAGRGARAMIVVQPNHPTGSCLALDEMDFVEGVCSRRGMAIVSDEVFGDYPWSSAPGAALPSFAGRDRALTFVLSGLSKVCGMPQLKLGWIAVSGPERDRAAALRGLEWIADLLLSVATPVQLALPRLLEARHRFQPRVRERLAANRERLARLPRRRPEIGVLVGEGGWVAVLQLPARRSGEEWALELLRRDVVVHPGHFYDISGEAFLVMSLLVEPAVLERGIEQIAAAVAEAPAEAPETRTP